MCLRKTRRNFSGVKTKNAYKKTLYAFDCVEFQRLEVEIHK